MSKECCFLSFSGNQRITNQIEYLRISQNKWATETIFLFPEKKGSKKQFSKKGREENVKLKHAACNEIRTIRKHTQA